mmetsp:Transcript_4850/g.14018  ORF Transcript_4850/g.14018 Transcript_4850/m.14018 type:complete len:204 (-) Transcript_4850:685-1296(-)
MGRRRDVHAEHHPLALGIGQSWCSTGQVLSDTAADVLVAQNLRKGLVQVGGQFVGAGCGTVVGGLLLVHVGQTIHQLGHGSLQRSFNDFWWWVIRLLLLLPILVVCVSRGDDAETCVEELRGIDVTPASMIVHLFVRLQHLRPTLKLCLGGRIFIVLLSQPFACLHGHHVGEQIASLRRRNGTENPRLPFGIRRSRQEDVEPT